MLRYLSRTLHRVLVIALVFTGCGGNSGDADITYVAIGASDAVGIGASPISRGYVYLIEERLERDRSVDLVNLGIPGAEISEFVDAELPVAVEEEPDLVTVFAGGNDIVDGDLAETFEEDLDKLLSTLKEKTQAKIFIATLPNLVALPRFQANPSPNITPQRVNAFNTAIIRQAQRYGATPVRLDTAPLITERVSDDGFHPSNEGYEVIADLFLDQILPSLP